MQLKHKDNAIQVTLTKPEVKLLSKACDLLEMLAKLPCDNGDIAAKAFQEVNAILNPAGPEQADEEAPH